jgi:sigma-B regulation protein RsbU (phosphoserine phosphatase)
MEVESLRQEISKLKTESAGLKVKSKLFENFAAMAHSCCRRPSTTENNRLYGRLDESYRSLDRSKQEIEAYSKALDEELEKGKEIQRDFLPNQIPQIPNWEIATYFAPAKQVSGDFYDVFSLPGENLGIVIADVADKGVGSALYMALIRSLIRVFSGHISLHGFANFSTNNEFPDTISEHSATADQINALNAVKLTNDYIAHEHGKDGMFATLFFGVINPSNGIMAYINAGHEPVFIVDSSGEQRSLDPTGPAVGMLLDMRFEIQQVQIKLDDIILGYTDGVIEALAPNGDFFTRKRLLSIVKQRPSSASALVEHIKTNLVIHVHNAPPSDDITMLAVRRLALN